MRIVITPSAFNAAAIELGMKGCTVPPYSGSGTDSGSLSHSGCAACYSYDGATLNITVVGKPFFISEGHIENQIAAFFDTPLAQLGASKVRTTGPATIALVLCCSLLMSTLTGCTTQQQANAKAIVSKIIQYEPEVQTAVDTVSAVVATLAPQDALLVTAVQGAFDADATLLDAALNVYTATPNNGTLASVNTALQKVLADNATQFLQAAHITNPASQASAKLAIGAVRTILLLMDGLLQPALPAATVTAELELRSLKLRECAPYLDKREIATVTGRPAWLVIAYGEARGD